MFKEPVMNKAKITSPGYFSLQATSDEANDSGKITAWIKLSLTVLALGLCFTFSIFSLCFMYCKKIIWNMDRLTTHQTLKKKKKVGLNWPCKHIKCVYLIIIKVMCMNGEKKESGASNNGLAQMTLNMNFWLFYIYHINISSTGMFPCVKQWPNRHCCLLLDIALIKRLWYL